MNKISIFDELDEVKIAMEELKSMKKSELSKYKEWETYYDIAYYDMWAVRPKSERSFYSLFLIHTDTKKRADELKDFFTAYVDSCEKELV